MRSVSEDRTARAIVRDEALRLFAERGPDAVSVRRIAAAAGVSPALVLHHFGSKEGLRAAVDAHVVATFGALLGELTGEQGGELADPAHGGLLAEAMMRHLPPGSPLAGYLRRLLLSEGEAARALFRSLFALARQALDELAAAGMAARGREPAVRAAFLLANDLAVFLLRDQLAGVLGFDPLSAEGIARWGPEMLAVYAGGLTAEAGPPAPPPPGRARDHGPSRPASGPETREEPPAPEGRGVPQGPGEGAGPEDEGRGP
ncbi:TetR/AcrR family transcriptional regulator [Streptomyces hoynatensis]|uniref:TetR/AcrR family transcriptional regulator n=1 Tax=Streptomyces hoynatensis TaxID=1141874 RepID=A0A3A9ZBG2_9ACTN|nr:TetR/AcrR family transcriptional regulator [Streptomyces hoynatensis]RKN45661.1 TetR/AcrR family transcriptional regulator [Streptomyces hoynatensis]